MPYTTVNEINRGKLDINQCAAGTVFRLAAILDASPDELINEIDHLDGVSGRYKGIDYTWVSKDGTSQIVFEYKGVPVTADTGAFYNIPSRYKYYEIIAGWMIEDHIEHVEWNKEMEAKIAEMGL